MLHSTPKSILKTWATGVLCVILVGNMYLPMTTGINTNKVEDVRGIIYRSVVSMFLASLQSANDLGLLLGTDEDREKQAVDGLRKRIAGISDEEFLYITMCEDRTGFTNRLLRETVRDYLGLELNRNKGV